MLFFETDKLFAVAESKPPQAAILLQEESSSNS